MFKTTRTTIALMLAVLPVALSSCMDSETDDYEDWRQLNDKYISEIDKTIYLPVTPDWAPQNTIYMQWHNDRSLTADNLMPMANSTVECKYEVEDINGTKIDNSYSATSGDSVYQCVPNSGVIMGFEIALLNMHVGDSCTVIMPYPSAYGSTITGNGKPYTNLIYHMKLKSIKNFVRPS